MTFKDYYYYYYTGQPVAGPSVWTYTYSEVLKVNKQYIV